jgi:hypothetical protein
LLHPLPLLINILAQISSILSCHLHGPKGLLGVSFRDMFAFLNEHVPLLTTSIASFQFHVCPFATPTCWKDPINLECFMSFLMQVNGAHSHYLVMDGLTCFFVACKTCSSSWLHPPNPNLQQMKYVNFAPTRGMPFSFLYTNQKIKSSRSRYVRSAYVSNVSQKKIENI